MNDKPFQQDARDLLLNHLRLRLGKQVEQHAAEVVRVLVRVAQLVRHRVEEEVSPLWIQLVRQLFLFGAARDPQVGEGKTHQTQQASKRDKHGHFHGGMNGWGTFPRRFHTTCNNYNIAPSVLSTTKCSLLSKIVVLVIAFVEAQNNNHN